MVSDDDDVLYRAPVGANKRTMRLGKQGGGGVEDNHVSLRPRSRVLTIVS